MEWNTSAPYHPSSNGLAEQAVQLVKKGLQKEKEGSSYEFKNRTRAYGLQNDSTEYDRCNTFSVASGMTNLHLTIDLLKQNVNERVEHRQFQQKVSSRQFSKRESSQERRLEFCPWIEMVISCNSKGYRSMQYHSWWSWRRWLRSETTSRSFAMSIGYPWVRSTSRREAEHAVTRRHDRWCQLTLKFLVVWLFQQLHLRSATIILYWRCMVSLICSWTL